MCCAMYLYLGDKKQQLYVQYSFAVEEIDAPGGGGGGGTQIWFRRGCAAEAAKPIPIFKGHFGGKGYPLLRVFIQENDVFVCKSGGYV